MIRIAVCDEQKVVREDISERIEKEALKEKCVTDTFEAGEDVLEAMGQNCYDIYFLDIEVMEGRMDGYKLAGEIRKRDQKAVLIFLSGHDKYACEAFEVGALRFLRKPIVEEKFHEAFWKAVDMVEKGRETFYYWDHVGIRKILKREILYFEVIGKEVTIKLVNGTEKKFKGTLREVMHTLQDGSFGQCYKSLYVHMEYVSYVGGKRVELVNGETLPVSRTYNKNFSDAYSEFCRIKKGGSGGRCW